MGDLVLLEDEVNPVMGALLSHGLEVTALHHQFSYDKPRALIMHIGREGILKDRARVVKSAIDLESKLRIKSPQPASRFERWHALAD